MRGISIKQVRNNPLAPKYVRIFVYDFISSVVKNREGYLVGGSQDHLVGVQTGDWGTCERSEVISKTGKESKSLSTV